MDVDTSFAAEPVAPVYSFSPVPQSAAPTVTGFNTLFFDTMSPRRSLDSPAAPQPKKRRSLSPEPHRMFEHENSSSPMLPSPSQAKLERMASGSLLNRFVKPTLQGLGAPSSAFPKRLRRPALSAMVNSTDSHALQSAYPVLSAGLTVDDNSPKGSPPVRRAFSALIVPSNFLEPSEDESSFDGPDMSSPAQAYSKRQQVKTIRRCDGTEDFRPLTGATAMVMKESPSSRYLAAGMPGFGDNEAHGKILPCHRVTEDGLMRITPETVCAIR
jgi:M-phase inducer tyrosine phosphatase